MYEHNVYHSGTNVTSAIEPSSFHRTSGNYSAASDKFRLLVAFPCSFVDSLDVSLSCGVLPNDYPTSATANNSIVA